MYGVQQLLDDQTRGHEYPVPHYWGWATSRLNICSARALEQEWPSSRTTRRPGRYHLQPQRVRLGKWRQIGEKHRSNAVLRVEDGAKAEAKGANHLGVCTHVMEYLKHGLRPDILKSRSSHRRGAFNAGCSHVGASPSKPIQGAGDMREEYPQEVRRRRSSRSTGKRMVEQGLACSHSS